jgi:hypothetical protein
MLLRLVLIRTDVSEELVSIMRVTRIGELGTLAVTSNQPTLRRNIKLYSFLAIFLSSFVQILGQCFDYPTEASFETLYNSSVILLYTDSIVKRRPKI